MKVYKGMLLPKYYDNGKVYHGKTKRYFYTPVKKLFGNVGLTIYYKKNTQFYRRKAIEFLMNYVSIAINEVTRLGDKTYLEEKNISILNGRNTLGINCYSKQDNTYIGNPYKVMKLIEDKGITEFYGDGLNDFAIVGYNRKDNKLYHGHNSNLMEIKTTVSPTIENIQIIAKQINAEIVRQKSK